jgi:hypothetical protein
MFPVRYELYFIYYVEKSFLLNERESEGSQDPWHSEPRITVLPRANSNLSVSQSVKG